MSPIKATTSFDLPDDFDWGAWPPHEEEIRPVRTLSLAQVMKLLNESKRWSGQGAYSHSTNDYNIRLGVEHRRRPLGRR